MSFNTLSGWHHIIDRRFKEIQRLIRLPLFLFERRALFLQRITNFIKAEISKHASYERRAEIVYSIIVPLDKHFKSEEPQSFIDDIKDDSSFNNAISHIYIGHWEWYKVVPVKIVQSIPSSALRNNDGMGVGRGLKTVGTLKYFCARCNAIVGFTPGEYWKHQKDVHNNARIRIIEKKIKL